ncbi:MAG: hypothetical protein ACFFD4_29640 [Candidatus Odinarchaeota archaeon]
MTLELGRNKCRKWLADCWSWFIQFPSVHFYSQRHSWSESAKRWSFGGQDAGPAPRGDSKATTGFLVSWGLLEINGFGARFHGTSNHH